MSLFSSKKLAAFVAVLAVTGAVSAQTPAHAWLGNDIVHTVTHPLQTGKSVVMGAKNGVVGGVTGTVQQFQGIVANPGPAVQNEVQKGIQSGVKSAIESGDDDE